MSAESSSAIPDAETFRRMAEEELNRLPAMFRLAMENVAIVTDDFPTVGTLHDLKAETPYDLLGLYQGWPLTERDGLMASGELPDVIHLYRRPILSYAEEQGLDVRRVLRHVLIHEIGHYFGYSDEEMEAIEWEQET
ncbi:MAG: metallopeptidase family protein [Gammaproteobacteria bacterium]|nr:MAG: metallopeptidase family protein [Gammaproteobacteria bacterium]